MKKHEAKYDEIILRTARNGYVVRLEGVNADVKCWVFSNWNDLEVWLHENMRGPKHGNPTPKT